MSLWSWPSIWWHSSGHLTVQLWFWERWVYIYSPRWWGPLCYHWYCQQDPQACYHFTPQLPTLWHPGPSEIHFLCSLLTLQDCLLGNHISPVFFFFESESFLVRLFSFIFASFSREGWAVCALAWTFFISVIPTISYLRFLPGMSQIWLIRTYPLSIFCSQSFLLVTLGLFPAPACDNVVGFLLTFLVTSSSLETWHLVQWTASCLWS